MRCSGRPACGRLPMADTLCLSCAKCYGDCPWSERDPETKRIKFQPVPRVDGRTDLEAGLRGLLPCGRLPAVCERREGLLRRPGPETKI